MSVATATARQAATFYVDAAAWALCRRLASMERISTSRVVEHLLRHATKPGAGLPGEDAMQALLRVVERLKLQVPETTHGDRVRLSAHLPLDLHREVALIAEAQERSFSYIGAALVEAALPEYFEQRERLRAAQHWFPSTGADLQDAPHRREGDVRNSEMSMYIKLELSLACRLARLSRLTPEAGAPQDFVDRAIALALAQAEAAAGIDNQPL